MHFARLANTLLKHQESARASITFLLVTLPNIYRFYRAMLCIRCSCHGPVSVCLLQVGVLLKRLNVGSQKQHHTIAQGLQFSDAKDLREIRPGSPPTRAPNACGVGQNRRLLTNNRLLSWKRQNRHMVSIKVEYEVVCALSNGDIADDRDCPLTAPNHPIFCILHRHS